MKQKFENRYTAIQRQLIDRLAEIERQDEDACAHCGGEDCACCEIYHDRMSWKEPDELFAEYNDDPFYYWRDGEEDDEELENSPSTEEENDEDEE